jgi:FMN phosphatase YigB (HAD superfamily)
MPYRPWFRSPGQTELLDRIADAVQLGDVAVLDLDGCLFDTRGRQVRILWEYGNQHGADALLAVTEQHFEDWSMATTLSNAGVPTETVAAHLPALEAFWFERFFSSDYMLYDRPMPGAVALVRRLHGAGAHVVYLTGRHAEMRPGTLENLRRFGFPLDGHAELITKPTFEMDDTAFKDQALQRIEAQGTPAVFLDNEPANVNLFHARHPDALVVFVATDHSPRPDRPVPELPVLRGFRR